MVTPKREPKASEMDLDQTVENTTITAFQVEEHPIQPQKKQSERKDQGNRCNDDTEVPDESFKWPDDSVRSNDMLTKTALDQGNLGNVNN